MELGVSVIICCYNSAARLPGTLSYIAKQQVPAHIPWEVLIINNSSTDDTVKVAGKEWGTYNLPGVDFDVIDEPVPGLNNARRKGIEAAKYAYLLFCDDDNWLDSTYVATAFAIIDNDRSIGVLGGLGIIEAEQPACLSDELLKQTTVSGPQTWAPSDHWVYGAGSIYRKSILAGLFNKGWQPITLDRVGSKLSSGGDVETCFMVYLSGYKVIADDRLTFKHFVPQSRQNKDFIIQMSFWLSYSYFLLYSYLVIIDKDEVPINKVINDLLKQNIKAVIRQNIKLLYKGTAIFKGHSFEVKKQLEAKYGLIRSIIQNRKTVIEHNRHIRGLLNIN